MLLAFVRVMFVYARHNSLHVIVLMANIVTLISATNYLDS
jgi:hypothetical protein